MAKLKADNKKLVAENKKLRSQVSVKKTANSRRYKRFFRSLSISLLVVVSALILAVGNLFFWVGNTVVKQDRFVAATEPIIHDPVVQQTMALYVTNKIYENIDVEAITEEVLPSRASFLAPQLTSQLKNFTKTTLEKIVANPTFQEKWNEVNAKQHTRLINFAKQYEGDGTISVNELYNNLASRLSTTKLAFLSDKELPAKVGEMTIVNASWLPVFHNVVNNIDTWRSLSLFLIVLFLSLAVWLCRNRRRTIYLFCFISASFLLATLMALRITRESIAEKAQPEYADGVRNVLQIVFSSFTLQTVTILLSLVLIGFIAWISGQSKGALAVKKQISLLLSGKLHSRLFPGDNTFVVFVGRNKRFLQWGSLALIAVVTLFVRLTLKTLLVYAILMLVAVLSIEVIGGPVDSKKVAKT